jgi:hypothetical protein
MMESGPSGALRISADSGQQFLPEGLQSFAVCPGFNVLEIQFVAQIDHHGSDVAQMLGLLA